MSAPLTPDEPSPFWLGQVITAIEEVPTMLRFARLNRGLSIRAAAKLIGVSFSTISRIENNEFAEVKSYLAVLRWLDANNRETVRLGRDVTA